MRRTLLYSAMLATFSTSLAADETSYELPAMLVSATRYAQSDLNIPASISIITRQQILDSGARSLSDVLTGQAGIQVTDLFADGSSSVVDMRGFGPTAAQNTLILVDGRRLNNSSDIGAPELNSVNLDNIEQIEIVHGSAGTLYGNMAVGGVINIITRKPDEFNARLKAGAGSYNGYALQASVSEQLKNGINYRLGARQRKSDNYRDHNDLDFWSLNGRLGYQYAQGEIFAEAQKVSEELQTPGALTKDELKQNRKQVAAPFKNDFQDTTTRIFRLGLDHSLGEDWRSSGELTYRDSDRDFLNSFRAFPGTPATLDRRVYTFNPRLSGRLPSALGDINISSGVDFENTRYDLQSSFGRTLQKQDIWAVYAQGVFELSSQWQATLGLRHAQVNNDVEYFAGQSKDDDSVTAKSAGLSYQATSNIRLFARMDENYRFATADESIITATFRPEDLKTQTGRSWETGLELKQALWNAKILAYQLNLNDEIAFDSSGFANTNLDKTRRRGLLLEGQTSPWKNWKLGGNYNYTDPTITDGAFDGNDIPLVAKHTARLFADSWLTRQLGFNLEGLYKSKRVVGGDFNNSFNKLDSYSVVNLSARYVSGPFRISAKINNLLDKEYEETANTGFDASFSPIVGFFPAPERNFWLTFEYTGHTKPGLNPP
ncbi:MAG: TonB-dependent receptor [gamma proteobacterium symbiont of Bathyaustriella thionipta]|nr:TonB-dependent receptor [gamma proteobacterium symbiont of Bathyaustriella thionipta]